MRAEIDAAMLPRPRSNRPRLSYKIESQRRRPAIHNSYLRLAAPDRLNPFPQILRNPPDGVL